MSWTTDQVPYQCSDIDSVLGAISSSESEIENIDSRKETAKELAEEIVAREDDDFDPQEVKDLAGSIVDELDTMEIDIKDATEAFFGTDDTLESIREACVSLRGMAEAQMDSAQEEISDLEGRNEDLDSENEELKDELNSLKIRNSELERLLNPMLEIPLKVPGLKELERWEQSLLSSPSSSQ